MSREAMQLALEALESDPISHAGIVSRKQAITALRQALETEPEALRLADALDDEFLQGRISNHNGRKAAVELRRLHEVNQTYHEKVILKREWVGLTDEEIAQGLKESWVTEQAWQSAVWWAEAKLKEKNQ
jgi:hypothetical protein